MRPAQDGPVVSIIIRDGNAGDQRVSLGDRLISFEYEDNASRADKCVLQIDNSDLLLLDDDTWQSGQLLEVSWGYPGNMHAPQRVIVKKKSGGTTLRVEGIAKSALMDKDHKVRTFENKRRSDVVRDVAREEGYSGSSLFLQETDQVFDVISQNGESNARFLRRLAKREGFVFYVDDSGLHWHDEEFDSQPTHVLTYFTDPDRGDVLDFSFESDLARQPGKIKVKGTDPKTKKTFEVEGSDSATKRTDLGDEIEVMVDPRTGVEKRMATEVVRHTAARTEAEAKREADARFKAASRRRVKLNLQIVGDPSITAKRVIEVRGLGQYLSGKWYVKTSKHTVSGSGYVQSLECKRGGVGKGKKQSEAAKNRKEAAKKGNGEKEGELFQYNVDGRTGVIAYGRRPTTKGEG